MGRKRRVPRATSKSPQLDDNPSDVNASSDSAMGAGGLRRRAGPKAGGVPALARISAEVLVDGDAAPAVPSPWNPKRPPSVDTSTPKRPAPPIRANGKGKLKLPATASQEVAVAEVTSPVSDAWDALPYRFEILLFIMAAAVRYFRISEPDSVVFDEVHFGGFVGDYHTGRYFFDIHPPFGKLALMWIGNLFGYDARQCDFKDIHDTYRPLCKFYILRMTAAFFGSLLPPLMFSVARKLGMSNAFAFLAGTMMVFESMHVVESRLILVDSQLLFYCGLSLWTGLKYWERRSSPGFSANENNFWCVAIGLACGAAVSIKFTALASPGMVALESLFGIYFLNNTVEFVSLVKMGVLIVAQFCLWYAIHFAYLPFSGEHGDGFMPIEFQRTLINNTFYDPEAPPVSFPWIVYELNREMIDASARIDSPHNWQSVHYQWMGNTRGVLYWGAPDKMDSSLYRQVYILGNPAVSWPVLASVISFIVLGFLYIRYRDVLSDGVRRKQVLLAAVFCFTGYATNLLPYLGVKRQAFIYHYMPALFYGILLMCIQLDWFVPKHLHWVVVRVAAFGVAGVYLYFSPWVYALPLTPDQHEARRWLASWT